MRDVFQGRGEKPGSSPSTRASEDKLLLPWGPTLQPPSYSSVQNQQELLGSHWGYGHALNMRLVKALRGTERSFRNKNLPHVNSIHVQCAVPVHEAGNSCNGLAAWDSIPWARQAPTKPAAIGGKERARRSPWIFPVDPSLAEGRIGL